MAQICSNHCHKGWGNNWLILPDVVEMLEVVISAAKVDQCQSTLVYHSSTADILKLSSGLIGIKLDLTLWLVICGSVEKILYGFVLGYTEADEYALIRTYYIFVRAENELNVACVAS